MTASAAVTDLRHLSGAAAEYGGGGGERRAERRSGSPAAGYRRGRRTGLAVAVGYPSSGSRRN